MALSRAKLKDMPSDAVLLTEQEAVKYQSQVLKNWRNKKDTWALRYGGTILGCCGALTGIYLNSHYRMRFKLFHYGQVSSYLPVCVIPALMCSMFHMEFVLPSVVLQKDCPLCIELRSSALQAATGVFFPGLLAPVISSALAVRFNTYDVPYLTQPVKAFKHWKRHTGPIANVLYGLFVGQALLAMAITYFEAKNVETVHHKLMLLRYDLDRQDELS